MKERGLRSSWVLPGGMLGVLTLFHDEGGPCEEAMPGQQFVGIDLHRRRSVIVRTTERGEPLETVRISNDVDRLATVMARAGEAPEVVLEATYGWYWAVDALAELGAHGASGASVGGQGVRVPAGEERRAGRRRSGRPAADGSAAGGVDRAAGRPGSCGSWSGTGPSWSGSARGCKAEVHAVLAKCGIQVPMTDLFGVAGNELLDRLDWPAPYPARVASLRRLIDDLDFEIDAVRPAGPRPAGPRPRLPRGAADPRHRADPGGGVRRRDR